ncbi:MAG: hypothetical protein WA741_08730 [Candidatus Sulfotelmatobacter sp.]
MITFESLATGVAAVVVSLVALSIGVSIYSRHVLGQNSNGLVAWDVPGLLGQHWMVIIIGTLAGIFLFGVGLGFWFFSHRVHR